MRERDRGQSELLGFLLVFSLVVLTIVLVGTTGFAGLNNAQDYHRTSNAEQAFTTLADNVDDVVRRGAPSRQTEIRLEDASLSLAESERITVTVENETPENGTVVETRPLVYDSGSGTTIAYSSGALVRQDGPNAVMFRHPDFVLTEEAVILPLVATSPASDGPVGGTSAVRVETYSTGTDVMVARDAASTVTIEVTSSRVEPWKRYLDGETAADCDEPDGETVTCDIDTERAYVTVEHVDVRFR